MTHHANATRVEILLKERRGNLVLEVKDNGRGITKSQITNPKSFGLIGMRERALLWGGDIKIKGIQGKGSRVTVKIPFNKSKQGKKTYDKSSHRG